MPKHPLPPTDLLRQGRQDDPAEQGEAALTNTQCLTSQCICLFVLCIGLLGLLPRSAALGWFYSCHQFHNLILRPLLICQSCLSNQLTGRVLGLMRWRAVSNPHAQYYIILYMLRLFAFLAALYCTRQAQRTNYDYSDHGDSWADCKKSTDKQSPINLLDGPEVLRDKESYLFGDYYNTTGAVYFLNTSIYVNSTDSFGSVHTRIIDGTAFPYKAMEMRLRMHSEHQVAGKYYDLELQVFHTQLFPSSANSKLAIGLLFEAGPTADPFLQALIDAYQRSNVSSPIGINLRHLLPTNVVDEYWFYEGSNTIPPCSNQNFNWVVSRKVHSMTAEQRVQLQAILSQGSPDWPGNWRKVQPANSNPIALRSIAASPMLQ